MTSPSQKQSRNAIYSLQDNSCFGIKQDPQSIPVVNFYFCEWSQGEWLLRKKIKRWLVAPLAGVASGWSIGLRIKGSPVWLQSKAPTWVTVLLPTPRLQHVWEATSWCVSIHQCFSLPPPPPHPKKKKRWLVEVMNLFRYLVIMAVSLSL